MNEQAPLPEAPRVFMSYSHDSDEHINWVVALATRLRSNGVDVCLDRWDVSLGGNLAHFMERAANSSYQVIVVVSESYARKSNEREGGAGVEAQMLSARLYSKLDSDQIIPVLRNNGAGEPLMPAFLGGRLWSDFRDEASAEEEYAQLLRKIHGVPVEVAPPLGSNPFDGKSAVEASIEIRNSSSRWLSPGLSGEVEFVHSQNSGEYTLGSGQCQFTIKTQVLSPSSLRIYRDPTDIQHVAVIEGVGERTTLLSDVSQFDTSNRIARANIGDAVVLHNQHGYWAIVYVTELFEREGLNREEVMRFHYFIQPDRSSDLSQFALPPQLETQPA